MNPKIYRQADSRWGTLPYPTKNYSFAHNGCGCCSVTHCIIEIDIYSALTPKDVQKFMVQYATQGHGTLWKGITEGLKHETYKSALEKAGYIVHWNEKDSMTTIFQMLESSLKRGVILFGKTKGPDGTVWTTGGHYIAFVDYKVDKSGKHWFYLKDSGGRHHDSWWCYEKSMRGDVRNVWICTGLKESAKPKDDSPEKPKEETVKVAYTGEFPTKTIRKGDKGTNVTRWQKFLLWMGCDLGKDGADGIFGKVTKAKTKAAQKKFGFKGKDVDGIAGPKTIRTAKAYKKTVKKNSSSVTLPKKCIDVSYWQGKISETNWERIKKTCGYAICRASYTAQKSFTLNKDSTFATNFMNAKAAGLKVGAYHYSQAITVEEAKAEAEYLCDILKNFTPTFYVVCDFEFGGRLNSKIGKKASAIANAFCEVVKNRGYEPCIYANTSTLNSCLTEPNYPVWVAQYNDKCTYKGEKVMWQYTSKGRVDGISGNVDLSCVY